MEPAHTLKLYFAENSTSDVSYASLWEGHKAVFRGHCICLSTVFKRNAQITRQLLVDKLQQLETWLLSSPSLYLLREIVIARAGLRDIDLGKVEKALLQLRQTYYDKPNKPHTLLVHQLCERSTAAFPTFLRDESALPPL